MYCQCLGDNVFCRFRLLFSIRLTGQRKLFFFMLPGNMWANTVGEWKGFSYRLWLDLTPLSLIYQKFKMELEISFNNLLE